MKPVGLHAVYGFQLADGSANGTVQTLSTATSTAIADRVGATGSRVKAFRGGSGVDGVTAGLDLIYTDLEAASSLTTDDIWVGAQSLTLKDKGVGNTGTTTVINENADSTEVMLNIGDGGVTAQRNVHFGSDAVGSTDKIYLQPVTAGSVYNIIKNGASVVYPGLSSDGFSGVPPNSAALGDLSYWASPKLDTAVLNDISFTNDGKKQFGFTLNSNGDGICSGDNINSDNFRTWNATSSTMTIQSTDPSIEFDTTGHTRGDGAFTSRGVLGRQTGQLPFTPGSFSIENRLHAPSSSMKTGFDQNGGTTTPVVLVKYGNVTLMRTVTVEGDDATKQAITASTEVKYLTSMSSAFVSDEFDSAGDNSNPSDPANNVNGFSGLRTWNSMSVKAMKKNTATADMSEASAAERAAGNYDYLELGGTDSGVLVPTSAFSGQENWAARVDAVATTGFNYVAVRENSDVHEWRGRDSAESSGYRNDMTKGESWQSVQNVVAGDLGSQQVKHIALTYTASGSPPTNGSSSSYDDITFSTEKVVALITTTVSKLGIEGKNSPARATHVQLRHDQDGDNKTGNDRNSNVVNSFTGEDKVTHMRIEAEVKLPNPSTGSDNFVKFGNVQFPGGMYSPAVYSNGFITANEVNGGKVNVYQWFDMYASENSSMQSILNINKWITFTPSGGSPQEIDDYAGFLTSLQSFGDGGGTITLNEMIVDRSGATAALRTYMTQSTASNFTNASVNLNSLTDLTTTGVKLMVDKYVSGYNAGGVDAGARRANANYTNAYPDPATWSASVKNYLKGNDSEGVSLVKDSDKTLLGTVEVDNKMSSESASGLVDVRQLIKEVEGLVTLTGELGTADFNWDQGGSDAINFSELENKYTQALEDMTQDIIEPAELSIVSNLHGITTSHGTGQSMTADMLSDWNESELEAAKVLVGKGKVTADTVAAERKKSFKVDAVANTDTSGVAGLRLNLESSAANQLSNDELIVFETGEDPNSLGSGYPGVYKVELDAGTQTTTEADNNITTAYINSNGNVEIQVAYGQMNSTVTNGDIIRFSNLAVYPHDLTESGSSGRFIVAQISHDPGSFGTKFVFHSEGGFPYGADLNGWEDLDSASRGDGYFSKFAKVNEGVTVCSTCIVLKDIHGIRVGDLGNNPLLNATNLTASGTLGEVHVVAMATTNACGVNFTKVFGSYATHVTARAVGASGSTKKLIEDTEGYYTDQITNDPSTSQTEVTKRGLITTAGGSSGINQTSAAISLNNTFTSQRTARHGQISSLASKVGNFNTKVKQDVTAQANYRTAQIQLLDDLRDIDRDLRDILSNILN